MRSFIVVGVLIMLAMNAYIVFTVNETDGLPPDELPAALETKRYSQATNNALCAFAANYGYRAGRPKVRFKRSLPGNILGQRGRFYVYYDHEVAQEFAQARKSKVLTRPLVRLIMHECIHGHGHNASKGFYAFNHNNAYPNFTWCGRSQCTHSLGAEIEEGYTDLAAWQLSVLWCRVNKCVGIAPLGWTGYSVGVSHAVNSIRSRTGVTAILDPINVVAVFTYLDRLAKGA